MKLKYSVHLINFLVNSLYAKNSIIHNIYSTFKYYYYNKKIKYLDVNISMNEPVTLDLDTMYKLIYKNKNMDSGFIYKFALFYYNDDRNIIEPLCIEGEHSYFEFPIPNDFTQYSFELSEDKGWIKYYFSYKDKQMETMIELSPENKKIISLMSLDSAEDIKTSLSTMANKVWIDYILYCLGEVIEEIFKKSDLFNNFYKVNGFIYGNSEAKSFFEENYFTLKLGFIKTNKRELDYTPMIIRSDAGASDYLTKEKLTTLSFMHLNYRKL